MHIREHQRNRSGGFTLIEVVVVFLLIITIVGIGALSLTTESTKKQIVGPADELKKYARRALQMSINNRRSYAITFTNSAFALREGYADVGTEEESDPRFAALFEEEREHSGGVIENFELAENMRLEVRRWGEKFFRPPEGDAWVFEPSGICEPIGVKLVHDDGSIEMQFNPLTAKIQDQSLIIGEEVEF